jgi:acetyltransferase-like isoleucine patch superfamily enzyme
MYIRIVYFVVTGFLKRLFFRRFPKSSFIGSKVQFFGLKNISIGERCTIGDGSVFTINDRSVVAKTLIIGDNTYIGRSNFFAVGKTIDIGPYCMFGNNCSIMCSDHKFDDPLMPYAMSGITLDKDIKIGANCWLGINVSIIGKVNIGHGCIIGANTVVTKDIPPFSIVVGNPFRVIKRFDFDNKRWVNAQQEINSVFFDETIYLEYLRNNFEKMPVAFHSSSYRFGDI